MTMSDDLDWKRWFKLKGQAPIVRREFSAEEMYQAFKARLIEELAVQAPDLRTLGILVERPEDDGS